jgi:magnesium transporter
MIRVRVLRDGQRVEEVAMADLATVRAQPGVLIWVEKELIEVRRIIGPMRDAMVVLLRRDLGLFSDEAQRYLQDVDDHLIRLTESVEDY